MTTQHNTYQESNVIQAKEVSTSKNRQMMKLQIQIRQSRRLCPSQSITRVWLTPCCFFYGWPGEVLLFQTIQRLNSWMLIEIMGWDIHHHFTSILEAIVLVVSFLPPTHFSETTEVFFLQYFMHLSFSLQILNTMTLNVISRLKHLLLCKFVSFSCFLQKLWW